MTELGQIGAALLAPFIDPASRTFLPALLLAAFIAVVFTAVTRGGTARDALREGLALHHLRHRSSVLDLQLFLVRRFLAVLTTVPGLGGAWVFATTLVRTLDRSVGMPDTPAVSPLVLSVGYSLALFVAWDASRYLLHRLMHEVPALWQLHQVHHSAEVLTPLTFHRIHPLESVLYSLRGIFVSGTVAGLAFWLFRGQAVELTILGVHGLGLVLNAISGNLRHSHVWLSFGPTVERWLVSPAQHQLHHSADPAHFGSNYGTWLALWDRLGGSLRLADAPPVAFGIREGANHAPDDLLGALLGPIRGIFGGLRPRPVAALAALFALDARAEEPVEDAPVVDEPVVDDEPAYEVIVVREQGVPRVAGSAHVIDEEELERYEYDDIHRALGKVPGVYVRGEDGFGLRPNIGIRGANSDRSAKVTLLEDGVLLAPAPYAAPAAYYFPMATRLAGIEVFKGPAATRHGPQTVGGAINLLTRSVPTEPTAYLDLAGGLRQSVKAHGYAGVGGERAGLLAEVSHLQSAGFKALDDGGPTGFDRQDVMLKGRIGDAPGGERSHTVELKLGYGRERSNETYLGLSPSDFEADPYRRYAASALDLMRWQRTQAELSWRARVGESFDVRTVAYHHWLGRAWTKLNRFAGGPDLHSLLQQADPAGQAAVYVGILEGAENSTSADQVLMIGTNDRAYHSFGVQSVAHHRIDAGEVTSELELGIRLHTDHVERLHTEDPYDMRDGELVATDGETVTALDSVTEAHALAVHVHEDLEIGRLHLLPGMRVEAIRTAAGTPETGAVDPQVRVVPLPGFGIFGELADWLDLFGGVHRGFSPVAPGSAPEARPESSWSYEAGLRASGTDSHAEAVGFFSDYDNITGQCTLSGGCDPSQIDQQFNGGRAWVYGVESVLAHRVWLREVSVGGELSYTLTRSQFRTGFVSAFPQFGAVEAGDQLPYVPEHQGAVRLTIEHGRGSIGLAANGRSGMRDVAGQGEDTPLEIPAAVLLDAAVDFRITEGLALYATGTNLANAVVLESWRPFGARPGSPLQVMVGAKARF